MFDNEELEILEALENGTLQRSKNYQEEIELAEKAAKNYFAHSKNLTIKLDDFLFESISAKAKESGTTNEHLITSLIARFAEGKIDLEKVG